MFADPEFVSIADEAPPSQEVIIPQVVIYELVLAGRVYVGKREVNRSRHNAHGWPDNGTGRLPDGYAGSGKIWKNIVAKRGASNIEWAIVDILDDTDRDEVRVFEQCAIAAAREVYGDRCVNIHEGGDGLTSADAQALAEDPVWRANVTAANRALYADPEFRASRAAMWADPDFRARNAEANRTKTQTPRVIAKRTESNRKSANQVTAPHKVVVVLRSGSKGGKSQGQAVLPFCKTGMSVAEVKAACAAAGVGGSRNPADKGSDQLVSSGLRNLQRAGIIRIDEPKVFAALQAVAQAAKIAAE